MLTNEGYFKQVDSQAMGSPPALHLANAWMNKFINCFYCVFLV